MAVFSINIRNLYILVQKCYTRHFKSQFVHLVVVGKGTVYESVNLTKMIQKRVHVSPDGVEYPKCVSLLKTVINLNYT